MTERHSLSTALVMALLLSCAGRTSAPNTGGDAATQEGVPPEAEERNAPSEISATIAPATDFRRQLVVTAKAIRPAVVSITAIHEAERPSSMFEGTPFEFFFRGLPKAEGPPPMRRGVGSGVVVDEAGFVVTNNHVVGSAERVQVTFSDNREVTAKVVGKDPKSDLAVVKVEPSEVDLTSAVLGNSDALEVGEWVVAVGSPFGLRQTVSAGIVSAKGRGDIGISEYEDFIQTDAAINPGNSGGPLVDLAGKVVGINTAIASRSGGNVGVGFAIPVSMVKLVVEQLIEHGKVTRGYVGLFITDLTEPLAESFGYDGAGGVLVQDVAANGPAARAGLRPGDIIVERDGEPVRNASQFRNAVAASAPGERTTLSVWRDGELTRLEVQLGELLVEDETAGIEGTPDDADEGRWGLQITDITPEMQRRFGLDTAKGALIVRVAPGSAAEEAGLQPGDIIIQVADEEVRNALRAQQLLRGEKAPVRVRILRNARGLYVVLSKEGP